MLGPDWGCALAAVGSWARAWCHCFGSCRALQKWCLLILIRKKRRGLSDLTQDPV